MNASASVPPAARPVIRHEPAVSVARSLVPTLNTIAARRLPIVVQLAQEPLVIAVTGVRRAMPDMGWWLCHLGVDLGGERLVLSLPRSLVERLVASVQTGLGLPGEPLRSLLVELALADLLDALDARMLAPSRLGPADAPPEKNTDQLTLDIRWGGWQDTGFLHLPSSGASKTSAILADVLARMPPAPAALDTLPVPLACEIGFTRLPLKLLKGLRPGDGVLLGTYYPAAGEILLAAGREKAARATLAGRAATLRGPFGPHPFLQMEMSMKQADAGGASPAQAGAGLDEIEVTLTFEFGRRVLDLRTLRSMGPGHIFDLGRDPEGPVDILANGKVIGSGEIVRIGETVGVRAVRLFGDD